MRFLSRISFRVMLLAVVLLVFASQSSYAFVVYDVDILETEKIEKLSDKVLLDTYIDVLIELEASTTFSKRAGFNQKEYVKYKGILRYRVELMQEIKKRGLELPSIEP